METGSERDHGKKPRRRQSGGYSCSFSMMFSWVQFLFLDARESYFPFPSVNHPLPENGYVGVFFSSANVSG